MADILGNTEITTKSNGTGVGLSVVNGAANQILRLRERGDFLLYNAAGGAHLETSTTSRYMRLQGVYQASSTDGGFSFVGDTNTGFKRFGAGTLVIYSGGDAGSPSTNKMIFSNLGNVAIGKDISTVYTSTNNPPGMLTISGEGATNNTHSFYVHNNVNSPGFIVRDDRVIEITEFVVAALPTATVTAGMAGLICVTDEAGGRTLATSDGSNWRRVNDGVIVS